MASGASSGHVAASPATRRAGHGQRTATCVRSVALVRCAGAGGSRIATIAERSAALCRRARSGARLYACMHAAYACLARPWVPVDGNNGPAATGLANLGCGQGHPEELAASVRAGCLLPAAWARWARQRASASARKVGQATGCELRSACRAAPATHRALTHSRRRRRRASKPTDLATPGPSTRRSPAGGERRGQRCAGQPDRVRGTCAYVDLSCASQAAGGSIRHSALSHCGMRTGAGRSAYSACMLQARAHVLCSVAAVASIKGAHGELGKNKEAGRGEG